VKEFKDETRMTFADIILSEVPIRAPPHNPGVGGWPTIRHFNKGTGYDGESYTKLTSDTVCTELGPGKPYMKAYVESVLKTGPVKAEL
jgi:hypothetical protein